MNAQLRSLLEDLYRFGCENDAEAQDRGAKLLNITPDTGEFLSLLIKAVDARAILEIGTSNGYSTLWLADAARETGSRLITVEHSASKAAAARENFAKSGLADRIELTVTQAGAFLQAQTAESFDFIFLDANRSEYENMWVLLDACLKPGGLLVVDNAVSHQEEMVPFKNRIEETPGYVTALVPVGKGELLAWKSR
ncbi:O-methyltransferase [Larkinella soli]|uniref:O-methyltransferase n=1 Tax=Larkinella soli TaxID=1770527 RepID=UPI000FFC0A27|nr:O-methyltransferase [Larkinella soli]